MQLTTDSHKAYLDAVDDAFAGEICAPNTISGNFLALGVRRTHPRQWDQAAKKTT
ncbi:MAG TPA: hypothetical protein VGG19_04025 [Tepidisphaeraceae bacterium]